MKRNPVAKGYSFLAPEERFRLILAADARGDDAEEAALRNSSRPVTLSVLDFSPWAHAFDELAMMIYLELLEEAARYLDAMRRWSDEDESDEADEGSVSARLLDLYLAQGFVFKVKLAGWQLFCSSLSVPPFTHWQFLPGFDRLQHAMEMLEDREFPAPVLEPEGMMRWLERHCPPGETPPSASDLLSAESLAADLNHVYRDRAAFWGA